MVTQWVAELGFELQHLETSGHRQSMCKGPGVGREHRELPGKKGTEKGLKEMEEGPIGTLEVLGNVLLFNPSRKNRLF